MKAGQPARDLTGEKFGMLTPLRYIKGGKWECRCDCGNITTVDTRNLNTGHTTSCGCKRIASKYKHFNDLTGKQFGYIKVLERVGSIGIPPRTRTTWKCLCTRCGKTFIHSSQHLADGKINSCGCVHSYNEIKIARMLEANNVEFAQEYVFPDLRGPRGGALRFDFAVFNSEHELSYLIEYNGAQHYMDVKGSWNKGRSFEERIERDQLKIDYCKKHNIPLIIIRYDQEYSFEDLTLKEEPVETIPGETGSTTTIDT